jgi:hypothetical protein
MTRKVRFTRDARKHKIGHARARFVIENNEPMQRPGLFKNEKKLTWVGNDDRGLELEVIGIEDADEIFIIHVMPTIFIKRGRDEY